MDTSVPVLQEVDEQLKQAPPTLCVTPQSLILSKVGEKFRGVYIGVTTFDKTDPETGEVKSKKQANFYAGGAIYYNLGVQLLRQISSLPVGVSVEIELAELKPIQNNPAAKTKIYKVSPLKVPLLDMAQAFGGILQIAPPPEADLQHPKQAQPEAPTNWGE